MNTINHLGQRLAQDLGIVGGADKEALTQRLKKDVVGLAKIVVDIWINAADSSDATELPAEFRPAFNAFAVAVLMLDSREHIDTGAATSPELSAVISRIKNDLGIGEAIL